MTLAEPVRLSKSLDDLDLETGMTLTLEDRETFSKSADQLEDSFSIPSCVQNSVNLNTYFDDNEEIDKEMTGDVVGVNEIVSEGLAECGLVKSPDSIQESVLGLSEIKDEADQLESLYDDHDLKGAKKQTNYEHKSSCSKTSTNHKNIVSRMLVLHNKVKSLTEKNWDEVIIDRDIQSSVNEFTKKFFENSLDNSSNEEKVLPLKALHEWGLKSEISKWLCAKLQIERDGWALHLRVALKEAEQNRKLALKAVILTQECSQQLQLLLECFNITDDVLEAIPIENTRESIQRSLELLMSICNALMEDRFQAMQLLVTEEQEDGLIADHLKRHLEAQEKLYTQSLEETAERARDAEQENVKLAREVVRMKKVLGQRKQDVEWLRRQMADIHDLVAARQVRMVDRWTSTDPCNDPTTEAMMSRPRLSTGQQLTFQRYTQSSQRLESQSNGRSTGTSAIHISQEKLHALKQRAKKLEESLFDAIASMDKLRKSTGPATTINGRVLPTDVDISHVPSSRAYGGSGRRDWHKPVFEVKGGPPTAPQSETKAIHPHVSAPKLNLKHTHKNHAPVKQNSSERVPPRETAKQAETKPGVELSETLSQLKTFKPQVGKVSKCLRCQKLFRQIDNHKLACLYHAKKKERMERYTEGGQLVRVLYVWTCCRQEMESEGCSYGQHV